MKKHYDVAAYIWPAYTGDEPRTRMFWPEGMGEWQSVALGAGKTPRATTGRAAHCGAMSTRPTPHVMEMQITEAVRPRRERVHLRLVLVRPPALPARTA